MAGIAWDILRGRCALLSCRRTVFAETLCLEHYQELVQNSQFEEGKGKKSCIVRACPNPAKRHGLCEAHHDDFCYVSEQHGKTAAEAGKLLQRFPLEDVPVERIDLDDEQYRVRFDIDDEFVRELARSIAHIGLMHPPVLVKKNGKYTIVSGFNRSHALNLVKDSVKTATARVVPEGKLTESELRKISWDENFKRKNISHLERALYARQLKESRNLSDSEIANLMELQPRQVQRYRTMLSRANENVLRALHADKIDISHVYELVSLDHKAQDRWLKAITEEGLSARKFIERLREKQGKDLRSAVNSFIQSPPEGYKVKKAGRGDYEITIQVDGIGKVRRLYRDYILPSIR